MKKQMSGSLSDFVNRFYSRHAETLRAASSGSRRVVGGHHETLRAADLVSRCVVGRHPETLRAADLVSRCVVGRHPETLRAASSGSRRSLLSSPHNVVVWGITVRKNFCIAGFTLIELLVVVLIIGILAAVAVPQYQIAVDKAKYTQAMVLMETVLKAEAVYRLANGKYTMRFDELDVDLPTPTSISDQSDAFRYYYPWGNCYTHNTGYITCYVALGRGAKAGYNSYFDLKTGRECWALPKDNARANRLCKAVTKNATGYSNSGGGFTSYKFK